MAELRLLDRAYTAVNERMIATGQAPHYTELARELGLSMEAGRHLLRDFYICHRGG